MSEASCEFAGRRGLEFLSFCNRNRLGAFIFATTNLPKLGPRRLYPFDSLRSLRVTVVGMVFYNIFCINWVKYRSDPSALSLRVTVVGMVFYNIFCINWVKYRSDPSKP